MGSLSALLQGIATSAGFGGGSTAIQNYAINGNFAIWQRTTAAQTYGAQIAYHADRFAWAAGTITGTVKSEMIAVTNFSNSSILPKSCGFMQRYEVQTAQSSLSANSTAGPWYKVEGFDLARMIDAGAKTSGINISFYVGAPAGTYTVELTNGSTDNRYFTTYVVSSGSTWQHVSLNISGADFTTGLGSGTWAYNNTTGLLIRFWLAAGTTSQGGSQNTWTGSTPNVPAGQFNLLGTTLNQWGITGLMISVGNTTPVFVGRGLSFDQEVQLCRRYYTSSYQVNEAAGTATTRGQFTCTWLSGNRPKSNIFFKNTMRAVPTVTIYNVVTGATGSMRGETGTDVTAGVDSADIGTESFSVYQATLSGTNAAGAYGNYTADAEL